MADDERVVVDRHDLERRVDGVVAIGGAVDPPHPPQVTPTHDARVRSRPSRVSRRARTRSPDASDSVDAVRQMDDSQRGDVS
jgi:hypothetical protein